MNLLFLPKKFSIVKAFKNIQFYKNYRNFKVIFYVDLDLVGFSSDELVTVATFDSGLDDTDLETIEVGFAGGGSKSIPVTIIDDEPINNYPDETELIAELQFEEGSSTIAIDSSPFGNDNFGSLINGAELTTVDGNVTGVIHFDGQNSRLKIANSTDINLGIHDRRTIAFWFKADEIATYKFIIVL